MGRGSRRSPRTWRRTSPAAAAMWFFWTLIPRRRRPGGLSDATASVRGFPEFTASQKTGDVFETIRDLAGRYQQVIVDAGGRDSEEFRSAMVAADRLYTPVKASQPDLETALNVSRLVKLACGLNPRLRAYAVVSMASTHPAVTEAREARELLTELAEIGLAQAVIRERKVFRDAIVEGRGVIECGNSKARAEIELLAEEIYGG